MRIKTRTAPIIVLSSIILASVLTLTMFGFYAYLEWKKGNARDNYSRALYDLNRILFSKKVTIDLQAKLDEEGAFKGSPVVYGTIKNNSNKKIYSLKLKVVFYNPDQSPRYVDTFYPVGSELEGFASLSDLARNTENFLSEGDSISFTHQLKNSPPTLLKYFKSKLKFAKEKESQEQIFFTFKTEGLDIR